MSIVKREKIMNARLQITINYFKFPNKAARTYGRTT